MPVEIVLNEVRNHSFEMLCELYGMVWMILLFVTEYGTLDGRRGNNNQIRTARMDQPALRKWAPWISSLKSVANLLGYWSWL